MKISDMTNEELADYIVNVIGGGIFKEYYAEAAARLRNQGKIIKMAHVETRIAAGLRRRLKVAEDALDESKVAVCHTCDLKSECFYGTDKFEPCCIVKDIYKALALIREEGGAK